MTARRRLAHAEARVLDWFFAPKSVAPLALLRMSLGTIVAVSVLQYLPHIEWLWGEQGLSAQILVDYADHPLRFYTGWVFGVLFAAGCCFAVGAFTRVSGLLAALMQGIVASTPNLHSWGWVSVMPVMLAIVALSPGGNRWSVDGWRAERRGEPLAHRAPGWTLRLLQVHVAVIYLSASWHRWDDRGWRAGEMVYAALANGMYTRYPYFDPQPLKPLLSLITWGTELLEMLAPFLLWVPRVRVPYALALMLLHLGLEASAILGWWQGMMVTLLFVFLPADWSARVMRWSPLARLERGSPPPAE